MLSEILTGLLLLAIAFVGGWKVKGKRVAKQDAERTAKSVAKRDKVRADLETQDDQALVDRISRP